MTVRRAACVIGWPLGHSRSPLIHNYWIRLHGLDAEYRRESVRPEDVAAFIGSLRQRGYAGINVTVPHKEVALAMSVPDDRAKAVGASNTLWFDGDTLRSTNTDVGAFLDNLDEGAPGWDRNLSDAVVLGAGGAARAVVYALLTRKVEHIHVVNRTPDRAEQLKRQFGARVHPVAWSELARLLAQAGLLVNATTLGMHGQPPLEIDLPGSGALVVTDLVYDPLETPLLKAARARGLRAVDGLGMLMHQAVGGFELWFGVRPKVTPELRALVEADLTRR
jgi:shikimate dehydrogenase